MNFVIRPFAREDIVEQFRWYLIEKNDPVLADRFVESVDDSIEQLLRMPKMGALKMFRNSTLVELRSWPVKGFEDIRIYYFVQSETLRVVRVLHGARDTWSLFKEETPDES